MLQSAVFKQACAVKLVHGGNISRFERDEREPSLLVILRYAQLAGISTDIFIDNSLDLPKVLSAASKKRKS
jgi:hypothetical protein